VKPGRALFDAGPQPFGSVCAFEQALLKLALEGEAFVEADFEA
jgi:hypothetical protein